MKILFTDTRLGLAGGTEAFLRDLSPELIRLGHTVAIYSINADKCDRPAEIDSVLQTTDIESLPFTPDVIHGQHHLHFMAALQALSGVPGLYHCHGAGWKENVPHPHPRIYRYLAMSRTLADRMAIESAIPPSRIGVLLNGVNPARFRTVRNLPQKPARALFFNGRIAANSEIVGAIREACSRQGLQLDFVGYHFNRLIDAPEFMLPEYDIVFASGISAIEAAASGCALIPLGIMSCGRMITPGNFDRFRQVNFSVAANVPPATADEIEREILNFRAEACAEVTARLRREADYRVIASQLADTYEEVIAEHAAAQHDLRADSIAMCGYLRKLAPLAQMADAFLEGDWESLIRANTPEQLRAHLAAIESELRNAGA